MIQMRVGQWETNSSSCHSFLIPNTGLKTSIPASITLYSGGTATYSGTEDRIRYFFKLADNYDYGDTFIEYLKSKGIVIEDEGENMPGFDRMLSRFRMTEEQLEAFCFGTNIIDCDKAERQRHNDDEAEDDGESLDDEDLDSNYETEDDDDYEEKRSDYENYVHVYIER